MPIEWSKATWYSQLSAVLIGIGIFVASFYVGKEWGYGQAYYLNNGAMFVGHDVNKEQSTQGKEIQIPSEVTTETSTVLEDLKNASQMLADQNTYVAYIRGVSPVFYFPFGEDGGGSVLNNYELVIFNVQNGSKQTYTLYELLPQEVIDEHVKDIPNVVYFRTYASLVSWGSDNTPTLRGRIDVMTTADPPSPFVITFFDITPAKEKIKKYVMPNHGSYGKVLPNLNTDNVLYESFMDEGLSLHTYNLKTEDHQLVVSYPQEVFDTYCEWIPAYKGSGMSENPCGTQHDLKPQWGTDGRSVEYLDFVTREKNIVELNI